MLKLPCLICGNEVEVRLSKKNKPYLVCDCGVQVFVRYGKAEQLLLDKVKKYQKNKVGGQNG